MAQLTSNRTGQTVDFQVDPQGTTTLVTLHLRIRSVWINRIASMLISVLLVAVITHPQIT
jgi:hypothetical protein